MDRRDRTVRVVGAPMDLGADRRGVDMGPSAIRYAGLAGELEGLGLACADGGDIAVPRPETAEADHDFGGGRAKYLRATAGVCEDVAAAVTATVQDGELPLVLGGDHTVAIGTANGLARDGDPGVLWVDAHGDFNVPATTPSGNIHGMALAAILGDGPFANEAWADAGVDPENVAMVGVRDLDGRERERLRDSGVTVFPVADIDERGIAAVMRRAIDVATGGDALQVSLDLDALDPNEAPGVGTPVRGGITYREAHTAMELVHERAAGDLGAVELVEVNPILDRHNRTAELAVELAASVLGQRTL
ncbi:arginase [Salinirussus salinus]|jgi:arginase|uniref:arginase n=1 Tax=Salinirussus salinus TaxID=1198300 RepID=UPI0013596A6B|nr:arginase [Salinirussus salinus]